VSSVTPLSHITAIDAMIRRSLLPLQMAHCTCTKAHQLHHGSLVRVSKLKKGMIAGLGMAFGAACGPFSQQWCWTSSWWVLPSPQLAGELPAICCQRLQQMTSSVLCAYRITWAKLLHCPEGVPCAL
jgi:hypothetical protein